MTHATANRRPLMASSGLALAILLLIGAHGAQRAVQPAEGRSLMEHIFHPLTSVRELMGQGEEMVNAVRVTASMAYNDVLDLIGDLSIEQIQQSLLESGASQHPSNLINDNDSNQGCGQQQQQSGDDFIDDLCAPSDPDANRNVAEIIKSRGFQAEEYDVTTKDGYILTIQRIVNPLISDSDRARLKPVILQHGLMSSSVDWVINSVDVRPSKYPRAAVAPEQRLETGSPNSIEGHQRGAGGSATRDSQEQPNSLGFYLANEGYDVFLANSRGNIYGQRHVKLSSWQPAFWDFTFDEQIKYDLPDTISFVQLLTNKTRVAYVGHSQGTTMMLGLLADQPDYADVVGPIALLAPVAYVANTKSPAKYFAVYTPIFSHINMWFGSSNVAVRYLAPIVCGPKVIRKEICANLVFLSTGFDEAEFNDTRVSAYLAHMPSGTSVKNIAHWGQEVLSKRFAHFDHGILANEIKYGQTTSPDYKISNIRSKSLALFAAENDWLAAPADVARLRSELTVPVAKFVNVSEHIAAWNHIDFLYGKDCGRLVNVPLLEFFHKSG